MVCMSCSSLARHRTDAFQIFIFIANFVAHRQYSLLTTTQKFQSNCVCKESTRTLYLLHSWWDLDSLFVSLILGHGVLEVLKNRLSQNLSQRYMISSSNIKRKWRENLFYHTETSCFSFYILRIFANFNIPVFLFSHRMYIGQRELDVLELRPSALRSLYKWSCVTSFDIEYTAQCMFEHIELLGVLL